MLTLLAFVAALGLLITVHEYGHYRVAVACGVKVLKFSIGFGKPIYSWRLAGRPTEFSIGMLPLGGFVAMLDEREGPVDPAERHLAFNRKPLRVRAAVVAAGPLANLLLAVLLYAVVNWSGQLEPRAVLASPLPDSVAAQAGLSGGEWVTQAGFAADDMDDVRSFDDLRWKLTEGALQGRDLLLRVVPAQGGKLLDAAPVDAASLPSTREYVLALSRLNATDVDAALFRRIGLLGAMDTARDRRGARRRCCCQSGPARRRSGAPHRRAHCGGRTAVARHHPGGRQSALGGRHGRCANLASRARRPAH